MAVFTRTIGTGGDYSDLAAWDAANGGAPSKNLILDGNSVVAMILGDVIFAYPQIDLSGWSSNSANSITVQADPSNEYNAITGIGAKIVDVASSSYGIVIRGTARLYIKKLGIDFRYLSNHTLYIEGDIIIDSCVFIGNSVADQFDDGLNGYTAIVHEIRNSLIILNKQNATWGGGNIRYKILNNCTIISNSIGGGFNGDILALNCSCTNVTAYNSTAKTKYDTLYTSTFATCAQNNNGSTPLGAGSINNLLTTDFTDYVNGDYSIPITSQLYNVGTPIAGITTDILGNPRA